MLTIQYKNLSEPPEHSSGFSLIELLVGMTIAMIIFLVISFVFANFENQKRVTTLASDTQSSGAMAIVELEQAIRSAGAGIVADEVFDCNQATTYSFYKSSSASDPGTSPAPTLAQSRNFAPVLIANNAANNSDLIRVFLGQQVQGSVPTELAQPLPKTTMQMVVKRGIGIPVNSLVLLVNGNTCEAVEVTSVPDSTNPNVLSISPGSGETWSPDSSFKTSHSWPDFPTKSSVYTIRAPGAGTLSRTYSVNTAKQLVVDNGNEVLFGDVVTIQAQYGVSATVTGQNVDSWVEPTGEWAFDYNPATGNATVSPDADHVKRIKAIRIAVVSRSPKQEPTDVTGPCKNSAGTIVNANGLCAWQDTAADDPLLINLNAIDANWKRYRYRVFQTTVPLRNLIWTGA